MEKIAIVLFILLSGYYLLIMTLFVATKDAERLKRHKKYAGIMFLALIAFVLISLLIDGTLFQLGREFISKYF